MPTFAVVDKSGAVVNRIVLNDLASWTPDDGYSVVEEKSGAMEIGGSLLRGQYTAPKRQAPTLSAPPELTPAQKLALIGLTVADLKSLLK
jgi:hypothetical protein